MIAGYREVRRRQAKERVNRVLLTAMAEAGGGNFYYIQNPDGIPQLFARAAELEEQARHLQASRYDAAARKQMKARSYQSRTGRHQDR